MKTPTQEHFELFTLQNASSTALEALRKERQMAQGKRDFSMLSIRAIEELESAFLACASDEGLAQLVANAARYEHLKQHHAVALLKLCPPGRPWMVPGDEVDHAVDQDMNKSRDGNDVEPY